MKIDNTEPGKIVDIQTGSTIGSESVNKSRGIIVRTSNIIATTIENLKKKNIYVSGMTSRIPGVGLIKRTKEAFSGHDFLNNRPLSLGERSTRVISNTASSLGATLTGGNIWEIYHNHHSEISLWLLPAGMYALGYGVHIFEDLYWKNNYKPQSSPENTAIQTQDTIKKPNLLGSTQEKKL